MVTFWGPQQRRADCVVETTREHLKYGKRIRAARRQFVKLLKQTCGPMASPEGRLIWASYSGIAGVWDTTCKHRNSRYRWSCSHPSGAKSLRYPQENYEGVWSISCGLCQNRYWWSGVPWIPALCPTCNPSVIQPNESEESAIERRERLERRSRVYEERPDKRRDGAAEGEDTAAHASAAARTILDDVPLFYPTDDEILAIYRTGVRHELVSAMIHHGGKWVRKFINKTQRTTYRRQLALYADLLCVMGVELVEAVDRIFGRVMEGGQHIYRSLRRAVTAKLAADLDERYGGHIRSTTLKKRRKRLKTVLEIGSRQKKLVIRPGECCLNCYEQFARYHGKSDNFQDRAVDWPLYKTALSHFYCTRPDCQEQRIARWLRGRDWRMDDGRFSWDRLTDFTFTVEVDAGNTFQAYLGNKNSEQVEQDVAQFTARRVDHSIDEEELDLARAAARAKAVAEGKQWLVKRALATAEAGQEEVKAALAAAAEAGQEEVKAALATAKAAAKAKIMDSLNWRQGRNSAQYLDFLVAVEDARRRVSTFDEWMEAFVIPMFWRVGKPRKRKNFARLAEKILASLDDDTKGFATKYFARAKNSFQKCVISAQPVSLLLIGEKVPRRRPPQNALIDDPSRAVSPGNPYCSRDSGWEGRPR